MSGTGDPLVELIELVESGRYATTDVSHLRGLYLRARPPAAPSGTAARLARVLATYPKANTERLRKLADDPETLPLIRPLIGDPHFTWPFADSLSISDEEALRWLPVVAEATSPSDESVNFARVMFCSIRRAMWRPAARALAAMAVHRPDLAQELASLWRQLFQNTLKDVRQFGSRKVTLDAAPSVYLQLQPVHLRRHVFGLMCHRVASAGAPVDGVGADTLLDLPAESMNDDADLSAVLIGWQALVGAADPGVRKAVARRIGALCGKLPAQAAELSEELMREVALELLRTSQTETVDAVLDAITRPRWRQVLLDPARSEIALPDGTCLLWSWVKTAEWCGRHSVDRLARMEQDAGGATAAMAYALKGTLPDGARSAIEALLPRLAIVADPAVWTTTSMEGRAVAIVEAMQLVAHPDISRMSFTAMIHRAIGRVPEVVADGEGAERRTHLSNLALLLVRQGVDLEILLRDLVLDESSLLKLAGSDNKFVATQVAVQAERLLRNRPGADQLRLLWRILQRNPMRELLDTLRGALPGAGTPLHDLVTALRDLDEARDRKLGNRKIAKRYIRVGARARRLCGAKGANEGPGWHLCVMACTFRGLVTRTGCPAGSTGWMTQVEDLLFGPISGEGTRAERRAGLIDWLEWVGLDASPRAERGPAARGSVAAAWAELRAAAKAVHDSGHYVSIQQCRRLADTLGALSAALGQRSWPEDLVVRRVLDGVDNWQARELSRAQDREVADASVKEMLDRSDDLELVASLFGREDRQGTTDPALLSPETLRAAHQYLLRALRFRDANRLRQAAGSHVRLPHWIWHIGPLLIGTLAGIWLVLDMGTAFTDLVEDTRDHRFKYVMTLIFTHVAAASLIAMSLAGHVGLGATRAQRLGRAGRIAVLHAGAFAVSLVNTAVVMWILSGTEHVVQGGFIPQMLLWGSLALFLGLFLGLILQGRGFTERDGSRVVRGVGSAE